MLRAPTIAAVSLVSLRPYQQSLSAPHVWPGRCSKLLRSRSSKLVRQSFADDFPRIIEDIPRRLPPIDTWVPSNLISEIKWLEQRDIYNLFPDLQDNLLLLGLLLFVAVVSFLVLAEAAIITLDSALDFDKEIWSEEKSMWITMDTSSTMDSIEEALESEVSDDESEGDSELEEPEDEPSLEKEIEGSFMSIRSSKTRSLYWLAGAAALAAWTTGVVNKSNPMMP